MKTYYAVHSENGFGVYQNYKEVMKSKAYLSKFNCKKFNNIDEAKQFAIAKYNEHQGDEILAIANPNMPLGLNWIAFRKEVISYNKSNQV